MYLKSIRAQGFKSFADKLNLEINPGITGIVGPNGSGKSNIVDAVRWVLGEQSVKSLRGDKSMTDCIFNGSATREPQKRAYVSLTFDNTDHYLNTEFLEVEIKRVLYNTGENEYYLNNSRVRLKDVTNLFIDSGAGQDAFNIISQGNVTDIVNSKSNDRRVIFESAAGVLKYKKRKEETLRKLEKTEANLKSLGLVIDELETTVTPLKKQSEEAKKYLEIKNNLESLDISTKAVDITNLNLEYQKLKEEIDVLNKKVLSIDTTFQDNKLEKKKLELEKLEDNISKEKEELLNLTKNLSNLESEKKLTIEREKYKIDKETINSNLITLKEEELNINKEISVLEKEISVLTNNLNDKKKSLEDLTNEILTIKVNISKNNMSLNEGEKTLLNIENRINILENNIASGSSAPYAVKNVINNPRLTGIHNTIGKLISVPDKYLVATDIALGSATNYIVVDNDVSAINAINYLKESKLGRATFFPISIIKSRYIPDNIINNIKTIKGYIGILSNLIDCDNTYKSIIENQLGQVIVVDSEYTLNTIGKLIDYKYRIVSLDGEILHPGGSMTGGTTKLNSMIKEKNELNKLKLDKEKLIVKIRSFEDISKNYQDEYNEYLDKENNINKEILLLNENIKNKRNILDNKNNLLNTTISELNGLNNLVTNKLDEKLIELIENIKSIEESISLKNENISDLSNKKNTLEEEINVIDKSIKDVNSNINSINNELKIKEINSSKIEVKLDNLLDDLTNEYNITYEVALTKYPLEMEYSIAKERASSLKKKLSSLGNVNLGAIDQYERLNERFEFLTKQRDDLVASSKELKDIISDMDNIMISKFKETFESIKIEFENIFKLMFKGGRGELKLSDPDDLLNTGIDIIAIPPGKKINSPVLLSGGEKALTAICLLFATLRVKPSPFVILDEAEAALDEVNVDMFGKYLNEEKKYSQFIVITHKKKMMEYADTLYGITMQESGVSKIVSAKLE